MATVTLSRRNSTVQYTLIWSSARVEGSQGRETGLLGNEQECKRWVKAIEVKFPRSFWGEAMTFDANFIEQRPT
jgi:hypothetical protein